MRLGVLCSGALGLQGLEVIARDRWPEFVATDKQSDSIVAFCEVKGIPCFCGSPRQGSLLKFLGELKIRADLVLSINYLFLLEEDVLGYVDHAVNFHGSLLPKYRGRTPHVWAIINGERETGVTAHLIDSGCDTGDILLQERVLIHPDDTGGSILEKFKTLYPSMILRVIQQFESGTWNRRPQEHSRATYFGKRTPEDGLIDWSWSTERVVNWIRAQAHPYPGAYSFVGGQKVIIDAAEPTDFEFSDAQVIGSVVWQGQHPIVKGKEDALKLTRLREPSILKNASAFSNSSVN